MVSSIVKNDDVPMFFLFNCFNPTKELRRHGFDTWPEATQYELIKKIINEQSYKMIKAAETSKNGVLKRLYERAMKCGELIVTPDPELGQVVQVCRDIATDATSVLKATGQKVGVLDDPEFEKITQQMRYIDILKNSFSKGWWGYIDPTSEWSLENLLVELSKLPPVQKESLVFTGFSTERVHFNEIFESHVARIIPLMKNAVFSFNYPLSLLQSFKEKQLEELIRHKSNLEKVIKKEAIEELEKQYAIINVEAEKSISKRIDDLKKRSFCLINR